MMKVHCLLVRRTLHYRFILVSIIVILSVTVFIYLSRTDAMEAAYQTENHSPAEPMNSLTNRNTETDPVPTRIPWEDPGPYHVAYPRDYTFVGEPAACEEDEAPFVALVVPVAPNNPAARDAIRKTWGNQTLVRGKLLRTFFVLGLPGGPEAARWQEEVQRESRTHRDLIQSSFMDTYLNLTIKTMVTLEWLATRCPRASYAMKIDSDVFLNVQNLVTMLQSPDTPRENYMTGLVWWHSPVVRDPNQKFFLPKEVISEPEYPPYPLGFAYIMSTDVPKKILDVSSQIKPIYIEDAYLGMCLKRLGVAPTDPPRSDMFVVVPKSALGRCALSKVVAVTTDDTSQLLRYWEENGKAGAPC